MFHCKDCFEWSFLESLSIMLLWGRQGKQIASGDFLQSLPKTPQVENLSKISATSRSTIVVSLKLAEKLTKPEPKLSNLEPSQRWVSSCNIIMHATHFFGYIYICPLRFAPISWSSMFVVQYFANYLQFASPDLEQKSGEIHSLHVHATLPHIRHHQQYRLCIFLVPLSESSGTSCASMWSCLVLKLGF